MDVLDIWNDLGYVEGLLFSLWIGMMYWGKCWIDAKFKWNDVLQPYRAMLWHGLEIGLMRVGEPFRSVAGDFLGVALHFITARMAKKINHFVFKHVRYTLYIHANNELDHGTPGR